MAVDAICKVDAVSKNEQPTVWQRHRMPIILGIIAVCLYLGSIAWMIYSRTQAG